MTKLLLFLLGIYQRFLSPDHSGMSLHFPGGVCRFTPTCSTYAIEAITLHGPRKGILLTLRRIALCHPLGKSGYDPVPPLPLL